MRLSIYERVRLIEDIEAQCALDFFRAASAQFVSEFGLYSEEDTCYVATQVRHASELQSFNTLLTLGVAAPVTKETLMSLVRLYQQFDLSLNVKLSPNAQPAHLAEWLTGLGFVHEGNSAKFYRRIEEETGTHTESSNFHIESVGSARIGDFVRIACLERNERLQRWLASTLGRMGWQHYLASVEGVPVATGSLFVKGQVGQFGWAATLPAYRGRGLQNALIRYRIRAAKRLNCELLSADANEDTPENPNPSYHNILRNGFQLAYLRPRYVYHHPR